MKDFISSPCRDAVQPAIPGHYVQYRPLYKDINSIAWPAGAAGLWTNQLTADGKLKDLSGNGKHGTITGATSIPGPWGNCRSFDGSDDVIDFAAVSPLGPTSVVLLFLANNTNYAAANRSVMRFSNAVGPKPSFAFISSAPLLIMNNSNYRYWGSAASYLNSTFNLWILNITGSLDTDILNASLYVNNNALSIGTTVTTASPVAWGSFTLGVGMYVDTLKASVAALAVYPRILSESERTSLYNQLLGVW